MIGDENLDTHRAVWFDIPVADLERSVAFYRAVLGIEVTLESYEGISFGVLEHGEGNGGCLVPQKEEIARDGGVLLYLNTNGRIREAVEQALVLGGELLEDVHAIGPHGFRALVRDSEGNRIALHSETDS
ncbi:MAG: VOC family protein [Planctomycetota bacterium]